MIENLLLSVGAMKAGTTWLFRQLQAHPQIHALPVKELHYFALADGAPHAVLHLGEPMRVRRAAAFLAKRSRPFIEAHFDELRWWLRFAAPGAVDAPWYDALFADAPAGAWCADFSNLYATLSAARWADVRRSCSRLRVVYTLRDPVARAWSQYKFVMSGTGRGAQTLADFGEFRRVVDDRAFWAHAGYAAAIARMRQALRAEELLILFFEDLRREPATMLGRICSFLGVPPLATDPARLAQGVNASADLAMPAAWRDYLLRKLDPERDALRGAGHWHHDWSG
jgi:hypothetical protein